ncbi:hypothetical protein [Aureibacter tunicatorum]|uniref:Uncharacterized protein n=1 Tax=Aureibacter tunicatorum TaxID=866807 RepID=A0AAE4BSP2_9BACT|nr:hypothetical protein [Aureibacter tunicatorum]MDR6239981.1 hypothetical protein [Aureibacter tunicatorum]BDD04453.1 hypothetical protein AUTU_19360 [Aureibacter tunicatorum]
MYDQYTRDFLEDPAINSQLNPDIQQELTNGTIRIDDGELYIIVDVTGKGGTINLVDSDVYKEKGVTNIDKGRLDPLVNLVLKTLSVGHAKGTNLTPKEAVTSSIMSDDVPAAIAKADLVIIVEDKPIFKQRVKSLMAISKEAITNEKDVYDATNWKFIPGDRPFKIQLDFNGLTVPDVNDEKHIVEVSLFGDITKKK